MRKLTQRDDRGVIAITVVVLLTVMLVFMAFAVDVGSAVGAVRSAQTSADAAALAIATDCARGAGPSSPTPYLKAGEAVVPPTSTGCGGGTVTVTVSKTNHFTFGGLLPGLDDYTAERPATAKWGQLTSSVGKFPITIGLCSFTGLTLGQKVTLHSYDVPGDPDNCDTPSGNFGFIENGCTTQTITAGPNPVGGTTGNNLGGTGCHDGPAYTGPGGGKDLCTNDNSECYLGKDVLVPVWDTNTGTGSHGAYHITTFALFQLTGWNTNGGTNRGGTLQAQCNSAADGGADEHTNMPCIRGFFKGFTTQTGLTSGVPCVPNDFFSCFVYLDQ